MQCVHTNHRQSASNLWTSVRNQSSVYFHLIPTERPVKAIINPKSPSSKNQYFLSLSWNEIHELNSQFWAKVSLVSVWGSILPSDRALDCLIEWCFFIFLLFKSDTLHCLAIISWLRIWYIPTNLFRRNEFVCLLWEQMPVLSMPPFCCSFEENVQRSL